jgi:hypothetical protein
LWSDFGTLELFFCFLSPVDIVVGDLDATVFAAASAGEQGKYFSLYFLSIAFIPKIKCASTYFYQTTMIAFVWLNNAFLNHS